MLGFDDGSALEDALTRLGNYINGVAMGRRDSHGYAAPVERVSNSYTGAAGLKPAGDTPELETRGTR